MESRLEEMLTCSVCRDIFNDPRQLPCGHSMCMSCLENLRDHSEDIPFRCPDCREFFGMIVGVQKSYTLTNIVQDFMDSRRRKVALIHCAKLCQNVEFKCILEDCNYNVRLPACVFV